MESDLNTPADVQAVVGGPATPSSAVSAEPRSAGMVGELWTAMKRDRTFATIVAGFWLGSQVFGPLVGWPGPVAAGLSYIQLAITTVAIILGLLIHERVRDGRELSPREGYRRAWRRLRSSRLSDARLASYVVVCGLMPLLVACYTGWKVWLNVSVPFAWDESLATLDRAIHGARYPWEMLQPLLNINWVTDLIVAAYTLGWIMVLQGTTVWQALAAPSLRRSQFLVASALGWPLAGNLIAGAYMSAGPWFDARSDPFGSPFLPLGEHIARIGGQTLWAQDYLFKAYESRHTGDVAAGISAMPSMHLVMATIVACFMFTYGLAPRIVAVAFVGVILVGSIVLGWHYAVDGYAGILVGILTWTVAGHIVRSARATQRSHSPSVRRDR
jgi:hypothetical protein